MSETLSYIESYFENQLTADERLGFEQRITADESFAQEVVFYVQARQAMRQQLLQQKQNGWEQEPAAPQSTAAPIVQLRPHTSRKWMIAVAASVIIVIGLAIVFNQSAKQTPQQLALQYSLQHFDTLSALMDGGRDSLQLGIAAYNRQDYSKAETFFSGVYAAHPEQTDALKYKGLVSFKQNNYDKAISHFQMLAGLKLYANPGMFYQAITLLQRNKPGDEEQARKLLQSVVDVKLEGSKEAQEWLKNF